LTVDGSEKAALKGKSVFAQRENALNPTPQFTTVEKQERGALLHTSLGP